jgi:hypothetical protein
MQYTKNPQKTRISGHQDHGICFGKGHTVQIKITHKDLLLVAGIVVALIIAFTTIYKETASIQNEAKQDFPALIKTPTPLVLINKLGRSLLRQF